MVPDDKLLHAFERPDLDEFLSALNGFLDKQAQPEDPRYARFLEIFCRTVGAADGHLLVRSASDVLESVVSCGVRPNFDQDFNQLHIASRQEACPLDIAFQQERVVAIVELSKSPNCPDWFMNLMDKYTLRSLVAVPLVGQNKSIGVLCAYYRDVCLFDQGTLDRLMLIGRMVGGAMEKSVAVEKAQTFEAKEKVADAFLHSLVSKPFTRIQVLSQLTKVLKNTFSATAVICGTVKNNHDNPSLTVMEGHGIPVAAISRRVPLAPLLAKKIFSGKWAASAKPVPAADLGGLASLIKGESFSVLCDALLWQGTPQGAVVVCRGEGDAFDAQDELLLERLVGLASLALHVG